QAARLLRAAARLAHHARAPAAQQDVAALADLPADLVGQRERVAGGFLPADDADDQAHASRRRITNSPTRRPTTATSPIASAAPATLLEPANGPPPLEFREVAVSVRCGARMSMSQVSRPSLPTSS